MLTSVFLCHAPQDAELAQELACFLRAGARLQVDLEEGRIGPGDTLVSKVLDGQSDPVVLVLLSPDSAPPQWKRDEWMPAFEPEDHEIRVIPVLARECYVPALLRQKAIDLTRDRLAGMRRVKSRLLARDSESDLAGVPGFTGLDEDLECLRRKLGDRPGELALTGPPGAGKTALGLEFCDRFEEDFEALFWLDCGERSLAGMAGDLAWHLRLPLEGDLESNLEELRTLSSGRRFLLVLDDVRDRAALELGPGGLSSLLVTSRREDLGLESMRLSGAFPPPAERRHTGLAALESEFRRALKADQWAEAREYGRRGYRMAREEARVAEAFEFMRRLFTEAKARRDWRTAGECARELAWIHEGWGNEASAERLRRYVRFSCEAQLWLPGMEEACDPASDILGN